MKSVANISKNLVRPISVFMISFGFLAILTLIFFPNKFLRSASVGLIANSSFIISCILIAYIKNWDRYKLIYISYGVITISTALIVAFFSGTDSGMDFLKSFLKTMSFVWVGMIFIFLTVTPFIELKAFITFSKTAYYKSLIDKMEKWAVPKNPSILDVSIGLIIFTAIIFSQIFFGFKLTGLVEEFDLSFFGIRDTLTYIFALVLFYFVHRWFYQPRSGMFKKPFLKFYVTPIVISFIAYVFIFQMAFGFAMLYETDRFFKQVPTESLGMIIEFLPLQKSFPYILLAMTIIHAIQFTTKLPWTGYINPDDPWLPQNNIFLYPHYMDVAFRDFAKGKIDRKDALHKIDKGIKEIIKQKLEYELLVNQWKTVPTLSDEEWLKYGYEKGSRKMEYSRGTIAQIIQIYNQWIHDINGEITIAREIRASIFQDKSRGFGNDKKDNGKSGHSFDFQNDF